jgi:hypothetical protein
MSSRDSYQRRSSYVDVLEARLELTERLLRKVCSLFPFLPQACPSNVPRSSPHNLTQPPIPRARRAAANGAQTPLSFNIGVLERLPVLAPA